MITWVYEGWIGYSNEIPEMPRQAARNQQMRAKEQHSMIKKQTKTALEKLHSWENQLIIETHSVYRILCI